MLVQDTLTGYVHEVPDSQLYETEMADYGEPIEEGQMVYDGLGNPVGFLKSLKRFAGKALRAAAPLAPLLPIPGAGVLTQAAQRFLPGVVRRFAPVAQQLTRALPGVAQQFVPAVQAFRQEAAAFVPPSPEAAEEFEGAFAEAPPVAAMPARPLPRGWVRRPNPYRGTRGRRLYLRCAAWPGPSGLVPSYAAQGPAIATAAAPAAAAAIVQPAPPRPRRVIRRRR